MGAVILLPDQRIEWAGMEKRTNRPRIEMLAVLNALAQVKKPSYIIMTTNSKFVLSVIKNGFLARWWHRGFKVATDPTQEILNADLWRIMVRMLRHHRVVWNQNWENDELLLQAAKLAGYIRVNGYRRSIRMVPLIKSSLPANCGSQY